ncbi:MAG: hypothetical protein GF350_12005 [Chitinivibrionales bacterium]|nr:hypothetical protein [Chitinivibrionales bacterium]
MEQQNYSIGHLRIKYLDLANVKFAQNDPVTAKGFIDDFLDTIDEESESGKKIKSELDQLYLRKQNQLVQLKETADELSYLEKEDTMNRGRTEIEINHIHDIKEVCWRAAMKYGLFYD